VGLKGEPQVKSITRCTEILTGKGRTLYWIQIREHQVYFDIRHLGIPTWWGGSCTRESWEDHLLSQKIRQENYHFFLTNSAHKNSR